MARKVRRSGALGELCDAVRGVAMALDEHAAAWVQRVEPAAAEWRGVS
jgi:hypothetical protein